MSQVILAFWGNPDVTVDGFSLADKNQTKITTNVLVDIGVRQVGAFCVSTDSGAQ